VQASGDGLPDRVGHLGGQVRQQGLDHRWLARLPPQTKIALTPGRMAVAEQVLTARAAARPQDTRYTRPGA
jgi:hypothetical protein